MAGDDKGGKDGRGKNGQHGLPGHEHPGHEPHAHEPHPHAHEPHPHEPHGHAHHEPHPHAHEPPHRGHPGHARDRAQPRLEHGRGRSQELHAAGDFEPAEPPAGSVPAEHRARGPRWARVHVITCSDSRSEATDEGGRFIRARLADLGHVLCGWAIVKDEAAAIVAELDRAAAAGAQAVLLTGGTGISRRDSTFEAVAAQLVRPLPGFGELFRALSYQEIGAAAMLSRAVAGVRQDGLLVFAMPGSPAAVRLACERLIFPELTHLLEELAR